VGAVKGEAPIAFTPGQSYPAPPPGFGSTPAPLNLPTRTGHLASAPRWALPEQCFRSTPAAARPPTAASHTYVISSQNGGAGTSTVSAGAGGAGVNMPGFIRITRVPT
jgi:hypothetical protein